MKNIQVLKPLYRTEEITKLIGECCESSWCGMGGKMNDFEEAWKALQREIALIPPDKLLVDLHGLLSKVLTDHTQIVHPETGKARLHVYWKK